MANDPRDSGAGPYVEDPTYEPLVFRFPVIPHYYGDVIRILFLVAAALISIGAPFYTQDLKIELPVLIAATIALACFAALTSPLKTIVMLLDCLISGVGFVIFQLWVLDNFSEATQLATLLREVIAIVFILAFYYSIKTFRAMLMHEVGEHGGYPYRVPREETPEEQARDREEEARSAIEQEKAQHQIDEILD